ncbi:acyltransferase family protein [Methylotenera versatilis]|uniref:Acyltransferase 3 n=1 Tax=Methylotenera versatilis (strain 301) TaxID=666681 RepID=D7DLX5_METV0|nr:acyltransferase [Methylotenera versatilis]ADI30669.1 acyltransferase 3 [Methylotenera versatilis 301]
MKDHFNRFPIIDAFKAIASQFIVLHHLAAYGPISDAVQQIAPSLITWLYDYARMAVQIFFVIGGYLAARSVFNSGNSIRHLQVNLTNRYLRLVIPFFFALVLAILCAVIARNLVDHEFIPDFPKLSQFLSHVLMLQGVLDFDSLLAGAWFIAVDFQLFFVMLCISWLGGKAANSKKTILIIITLTAAASLFWFNRHERYDDWAIYFFGAYGLGAIAYYAGQREHSNAWLWLNISIAMTAILIDFRLRILIAALTALALFFTRNVHIKAYVKQQRFIHYLGSISYALFLVHFSVLMLANAIFSWLNLKNSLLACLFMLLTWAASLVLADLFHRKVEKPTTLYLKQKVHKNKA